MASAEGSQTTATTITEPSQTAQQTSEMTSIKLAFPNRCRIMCDVGGYSNVVTVQPENLDVTIKFQLTAAYPTVIPEIAIRSASLREESIMDLRQLLLSKARQMIGQPMIQALIAEAESELKAHGLKPGKSVKVSEHTYLDKKHKKKNKSKKKPKSEDEVEEKKLPPMKTADDVVKRIIWDDALEKDDFVVGYFDRFRGLVEKYFSAFSWEDLASVDYDVLAIPKHRIQYFKYKDVKVWDKPRRIDNVFGSAEGTKTIDVVIKEVQEQESQRQAGAAGSATNVHVEDKTYDDDNDDDDDDDYDEDSSDDDGIVVTIGGAVNIGMSREESKNKPGEKRDEGASAHPEDDDDEDNNFNPYWRDKLRPNYFLCVRITSEDIIEKIGVVQDHLMEKEPLFAECCIPGAALHVTLTCIGLETAEQLSHCMDALNKIKPELQAALPQSVLTLHGVSHFYNRVVYAQVQYKKDFISFCNLLKMLLREAGVSIRDGYEFVPHATIMKVTRPVSRQRGSKNIDPAVYSKFTDMHFGKQKVDSVFLCSMGNERRGDGFYLTPLEFHFD